MVINAQKICRRVQIAFIYADIDRHFLLACDCRHSVNEKGFRHRIDIGRKHNQCINVGYRRADKAIFSGENFLHHPLPLLQSDFHHIAGERNFLSLSQMSAATAGNHTAVRLHIIEATE